MNTNLNLPFSPGDILQGKKVLGEDPELCMLLPYNQGVLWIVSKRFKPGTINKMAFLEAFTRASKPVSQVVQYLFKVLRESFVEKMPEPSNWEMLGLSLNLLPFFLFTLWKRKVSPPAGFKSWKSWNGWGQIEFYYKNTVTDFM